MWYSSRGTEGSVSVVRPVRFSAWRAALRCWGLIVWGAFVGDTVVVEDNARRIFLNSG